MPYPATYRYTREHEWIAVEGNTGLIGITDYAQSSLGDIVYVDLPKVGDTVAAGAPLGAIESVKTVSEIYAPVSGTVIAINEELVNAPERLNQDPHGTWIVRVEMADAGELAKLLDAAAYEAFLAEESN